MGMFITSVQGMGTSNNVNSKRNNEIIATIYPDLLEKFAKISPQDIKLATSAMEQPSSFVFSDNKNIVAAQNTPSVNQANESRTV